MNLAQTFDGARPLAQHCAELTMRGPQPEEQMENLSAWRRDVGKALSEEFAALLAGGKVGVAVSEAETLTGQEVFKAIGPVAANCLLRCGADDRTALLSFDYANAIALTDRSFGGEGKASDEPAETLARSAALWVDQAAKVIAQVLARVSGAEGQSGDVIVRSESAARLKPFAPTQSCALFTITFGESEREPWRARLAIPEDLLDQFVPDTAADAVACNADTSAAPGHRATAFGAIPLALRAVLAEFDMSLGKLEQLAPGDQIPIAVPREVPLQIGARTFAHGSIGVADDRMALQVTRTSSGGLS